PFFSYFVFITSRLPSSTLFPYTTLFRSFELALEDLTRAADLFRQIHSATNGVDGWVSLEVSPTLAYDTSSTVAAARDLHARAGRDRKSTRLNSSHQIISYAVFCLKKKIQ